MGRGQHFSSCKPKRFVLREGALLHLALLLCARQVVRSKDGGTRQGGEGRVEKVAENKVELPRSPSAVNHQHNKGVLGNKG